MSELEMWLEGNDESAVVIVCARESCMKPGPVSKYNPRGLYYAPEPIEPYHPNPAQVAAAWAEHEARHGP